MGEVIKKTELKTALENVKDYVDSRPAAGVTAGEGINITNDVISTDDMTEAEMTAVTNEVFGASTVPDTMGYDQIYSTTETRVGTWIDGKPLYQKTISYTLPTHSIGAVLDIPNSIVSNLDAMTDISGTCTNSTDCVPICYNNYVNVVYNKSAGLRFWDNAVNYGGAVLIITLKYTKETD